MADMADIVFGEMDWPYHPTPLYEIDKPESIPVVDFRGDGGQIVGAEAYNWKAHDNGSRYVAMAVIATSEGLTAGGCGISQYDAVRVYVDWNDINRMDWAYHRWTHESVHPNTYAVGPILTVGGCDGRLSFYYRSQLVTGGEERACEHAITLRMQIEAYRKATRAPNGPPRLETVPVPSEMRPPLPRKPSIWAQAPNLKGCAPSDA